MKNFKRQTRKRMMFTGTLLILMILVTGTFAFEQFNQGAFNPAWDFEISRHSARLHDNFEDRARTGSGSATGPGHYNKDVFVEIFGYGDYFVRLQLREFLEIDGEIFGTVVDETTPTNNVVVDLNDPMTWPILQIAHTNHNPSTGTLDRYPNSVSDAIGEYVQLFLGHTEPEEHRSGPAYEKIFMPTHNHVTRPPMTNLAIDNWVTPSFFQHPSAHRFSHTTGRGVDRLACHGNTSDVRCSFQNIFEDDEVVNHASRIVELGLQTGPARHTGAHDFWMLHEDAVAMNAYCQLFYEDNDEFPEGSVALCTELAANIYSRSQHTANRIFLYEGRITQQAYVTMQAQATLRPMMNTVDAGAVMVPGTPVNGIMTLDQFEEFSLAYCGEAEFDEGCRLEGNFWIADTRNPGGWFYWNGPLLGRESRIERLEEEMEARGLEFGEDPIPADLAWLALPTSATSLLLDAFHIDEDLLPAGRADWQYIIHVGSEFFTPQMFDIFPETGEFSISEAAMDLILYPRQEGNWVPAPDGSHYGPGDGRPDAAPATWPQYRLTPNFFLQEAQANNNVSFTIIPERQAEYEAEWLAVSASLTDVDIELISDNENYFAEVISTSTGDGITLNWTISDDAPVGETAVIRVSWERSPGERVTIELEIIVISD